MARKVFSSHLIKRPICTREHLVTKAAANKSLLRKKKKVDIFLPHIGQLLINLNSVKSAWRHQELSMASSKGALISLTFPVIISMPSTNLTQFTSKNKRGLTLKLCFWMENNLLIDVFQTIHDAVFCSTCPSFAQFLRWTQILNTHTHTQKYSTWASVFKCKTGTQR